MAQAFWIAGQRITREELDETKIGYVQQLLGYDHTHGVRPTCMCRSPGITMSVRKLGSRYVLAKMPDSGPTHALLCDSYALPNAMTGRSGYHLKAIEEGDDGSAIVRLDAALRKQTDKLVTKPAQRIQPGRTVVKRDSTTLAGLLQYGWERMGLNRWSPKMKGEDGRSKRGWWTVHKEGNDWLAQLKIGRDRAPQVMIIPPSLQVQQRSLQLQHLKTFLQNRLAFAGKEENYVLILAPIKAIHETDFGGRIELLHLPEFTFWLSQHVLNSIQRRFERELGALNATPDKKSVQDDRVVGLFKIAALKNKVDQLRILDAGLLRVTPDWIPVHSSYESILARALVGQQRYFQKPLRYDADTETVFPDFLLTDCGAVPVPLEVFGFTNNPTYESRKQAKLNYYRSLDAPFWCWDVTLHGKTENDLPPLPKPQFSEPRSAIATETRLGRVLEISASPAESSSATSN